MIRSVLGSVESRHVDYIIQRIREREEKHQEKKNIFWCIHRCDAIGSMHLAGSSLIALKGPHREALIDECHTNGGAALLAHQMYYRRVSTRTTRGERGGKTGMNDTLPRTRTGCNHKSHLRKNISLCKFHLRFISFSTCIWLQSLYPTGLQDKWPTDRIIIVAVQFLKTFQLWTNKRKRRSKKKDHHH